jgi:hypothetical protein
MNIIMCMKEIECDVNASWILKIGIWKEDKKFPSGVGASCSCGIK